MIDRAWHKDAVIYQLHVRTFADGNGDGIGDFTGLLRHLDYLEFLGVTCIWLLPFYESPRRDDGYDVSHYERVHPDYGTLADFERFLAEAHRRHLRVITELVINHTSDQHPWFQAARHAPVGSAKRDFYVWSDTPHRYQGARIIFSDAETSNWTWDPVAGAYHWHRFFHHQPDLNFENPHVRLAVLKVMRFWFDRGVDGLRLDAIAHLYEREGTSCDNLPETHAFLRWLRADIDARYEDRVLLAEANQPPAVLREYFGEADECHMAFHFPLVAGLFASFAAEDSSPIGDIVRQTTALPAACQWAVFLRNHDDLSLSALGEAENARLTALYAPEPAMQLHGGICRRLTPMLDRDQRRVELAFALLLSLPGSPVIYYGDEIGMNGRLDLPDRDGLRTPMQWDDSLQAGFTTAAAPTILLDDDDEHGFRRVNVALQRSDASSYLQRVRTMIHARRAHPSFGRGRIDFLETDCRAVLAFTREWGDDRVLVLANLSAQVQHVALRAPWPARASHGVLRQGERISAGRVTLEIAPYDWEWWIAGPD